MKNNTIIKDNYKISEVSKRTPNMLKLKGQGLIESPFEMNITTDIQTRFLTKALWYLEAAAVLGHKEAPFYLSIIYDGGEEFKNKPLEELWQAIGCELGDAASLNDATERRVVFDAKTKEIAKRYADHMRSVAKIYNPDAVVSLEQIEGAVAAWNTADWEHHIKLTPHTMELAEECGALQEVPALIGDADQSCCIIM